MSGPSDRAEALVHRVADAISRVLGEFGLGNEGGLDVQHPDDVEARIAMAKAALIATFVRNGDEDEQHPSDVADQVASAAVTLTAALGSQRTAIEALLTSPRSR
jgi:hypothetical protein